MTGPQFCKTVCNGDTSKVSTLLSTQDTYFFINYQDTVGSTPLIYTVGNGNTVVTTQILTGLLRFRD